MRFAVARLKDTRDLIELLCSEFHVDSKETFLEKEKQEVHNESIADLLAFREILLHGSVFEPVGIQPRKITLRLGWTRSPLEPAKVCRLSPSLSSKTIR